VPAGTLIVSATPTLAFAAMIAERSEICPDASSPVTRFAATVSAVVLTLKIAGATRDSNGSSAR